MRVLVCDDDPDGRESLVALLRSAGHEAGGTRNADEALAYWHAGGWDVLILDWVRTGAAQLVRQAPPEMRARILIWTGAANGTLDDLPVGLVGGILRKPANLSEIEAMLAKIHKARG